MDALSSKPLLRMLRPSGYQNGADIFYGSSFRLFKMDTILGNAIHEAIEHHGGNLFLLLIYYFFRI